MTYTPEAIKSMKFRGALGDTIDMTRALIESLTGIPDATFVKNDFGEITTVNYGFYHGNVWIDPDAELIRAETPLLPDWIGKWRRAAFSSDRAALSYAAHAVRNELERLAKRTRAEAIEDLKILEAAV